MNERITLIKLAQEKIAAERKQKAAEAVLELRRAKAQIQEEKFIEQISYGESVY